MLCNVGIVSGYLYRAGFIKMHHDVGSKSPVGPANDWLLHEPGSHDFATVYFDSLPSLSKELEQQLTHHPVFGPLMKSASPEALEASARASQERMERAFAGEWFQYEEGVRRDGATYAAMGIKVHDWYELTTLWSRRILPILVQRLFSEPQRLTAALTTMQRFLDSAMTVLSEAYIAASESQVRRGEEDLKATIDSIADAVITTDAQGKIDRFNPGASALTGQAESKAVGQMLHSVIKLNPDTALIGEAGMRLERGEDHIPVLVSRAPILRRDGSQPGEVLVIRDVRTMRAREHEIARWSALFQGVAWGLAVTDSSGLVIEMANEAFARMYGFDPERIHGKDIVAIYAEGEVERIRRVYSAERASGRLSFESIHIRADGTRFPVRIDAARIPGKGHDNAWVLSVHDLTELKKAAALQLRSAELEARNRQVEEASRLKSEFLANMSHELRTPLNSILGFSELMQLGEVGPLNAQQKEFVGDIHASGKHLLRLINDVLDLSKVEAGKMEFHPETVDVRNLLSEVIGVLKGVAHEKRITILSEVDETVRSVHLDPARFKQVLYNYVSNALKFSAVGAEVEVHILPEGNTAFRLEVRDRGVGIPRESQSRLFTEFEQLDAGRSKAHGGTGLGLSLTKRLVEAQGGSVGLVSEAGQGSVFYAILPLHSTERSTLPRPQRIDGATPNASRILVIEDDAEDQKKMVDALLAAGYAVDTAVTGAQALQAVSEHAYDAITLDLLLPDTSGLDVLAALRCSGRSKKSPVIVVSIITDHVTSGFVIHDFIEKPLDTGVLLDSLLRAGVSASSNRPILVVDDDERSARLAAAALGQLGFQVSLARDGEEALAMAQRETPSAVVLDLVMPNLDGFGFLERFRANLDWAEIPVLVWTVRDLSRAEADALLQRAEAVLPKDGTGAKSLVEQLRKHIPIPVPTVEQS